MSELIICKIAYAQNNETRDSKKITEYNVLSNWPNGLEFVTSICSYVNSRADYAPIPIADVTNVDFPNEENIIQKASLDGTIIELTAQGFEKLVTLIEQNDAYLYDQWTDIPKSGLGTIRL